jgi:hypothetical protein
LRTASRRVSKRVRHQEGEPNHQGEKSKKRLLQGGDIAACAVTYGPYAQPVSGLARQKHNRAANEKKDNKRVAVQVSHDRA